MKQKLLFSLPKSLFFVCCQVLFVSTLSAQYCVKNHTGNATGVFIANVELNTINNPSADGNYVNFTAISTALEKSQSYNLKITANARGQLTDVYIDWNQDNDFADSGERVVDDNVAEVNETYVITVPISAVLGVTRMRIVHTFNGIPSGASACGTGGFGDVEDYTLKITTPYYSRQNGDWNSGSTWSTESVGGASCDCVPDGECAKVTIGSNHDVSLTSDTDVGELFLENSGTLTYFSNNLTLTVAESGSITMDGTSRIDKGTATGTGVAFAGGSSTLNITGSGAVMSIGHLISNASSLSIGGAGEINLQDDLEVTQNGSSLDNLLSNDFTIGGKVSLTGVGASLTNSAESTLNIEGDFQNFASSTSLINEGTINWAGSSYDASALQAMTANVFDNVNTNTLNYVRIGDQAVFPMLYKQISAKGSGLKTLQGATSVDCQVQVESASFVVLDDFNLTIGNNCGINDPLITENDGFVINNGSGALTIEEILMPRLGLFSVGTAVDSYTSLTIFNFGDADDFTVKVSDGVRNNVTEGAYEISEVVDKTWHITEGIAGGSNLYLFLYWTEADELTDFDINNASLYNYEEPSWHEYTAGSSSSDSDLKNIGVSVSTHQVSTLSIGSGGTILPIVLSRFDAEVFESYVHISWTTATEINNDFFTIEKSVDGIDWSWVKEVEGAGDSREVLEYDEVDYFPHQGTSYYRLKQTDYDGSFAYSEIVVVDVARTFNQWHNVYPNPTLGLVHIDIPRSELKEVSVMNPSGMNVTEKVKIDADTYGKTTLDTHALEAGIYFLNVAGRQYKIFKK